VTLVPAPIGPQGQRAELYTGSFALLVGVSEYDVPTWARLDSISGELAEVAKALRDTGFDTVEQSMNPTGQALRRLVEDFIGKYGYTPGHRLVFFFAGHGYTLDNGERGYFVPRDAPDPRTNEAGFRRTALSMQQVSTWAQDLVAKHAMFVFDSCFSGTIFRTRGAPEAPARISALTARPVREFLSAGSANEPVPARSTFSPVFVRGVRGAADFDKDGYVTGVELGNYVQRELIQYKTGQTPQFGKIRDVRYDEGDVVFAVPAPLASTLDPDTALKTGIEKYRATAYDDAFPLLLRAGNAGRTDAAFYLGYMYENGLGVPQDYPVARKWYEQAAATGSAVALNNLGVLYGLGRGVPTDFRIALDFFRKSAAAGYVTAFYNVGLYYEDGKGVTADKSIAVGWYKKAGMRGYAGAVQALDRLGETDAVTWAKSDPAEALKVGLDRFNKNQDAEAFNPLLRAAVSGKTEAASSLGYLYQTGLGTPFDFDDARFWNEKGAAAGNPMAMNNLGALYAAGRGVPQDYLKALDWYRKAADLGFVIAFKNLGNLYERGLGVPANRAEAVSWYRKAADRNNADAIAALARLGESAGGSSNNTSAVSSIDPDTALKTGLEKYRANKYDEAFPLLLRAGNAGKSEAAFYVGYLYDQGFGVSQDYVLARKWYEQAAATGDAVALNNLGVLYGLGRGVPADARIALDWYRKAAAAGFAGSFFNIGVYYENGRGVPVDKAAAVGWYKKAAMRGHASALQALERLGETDAVTWAKADPAEALRVGLERFGKSQRAEAFNPLLRAAASGKMEAAMRLGYLYSHGLGTSVDYDDARSWYEKAAAGGDTMAMNNLGALYGGGNGVPQNYQTALEWYRKAAASGVALAMVNIGDLYELGRGVPANRSEAVNWFRRAAQLKHESAIQSLTRLGETVDGPSRTTTGAFGVFSVPVNPGTYRVAVERPGFTNVDCEVKVADFGNPNLNTNVVLTVGASPVDFSFVVRSVPGGRPDAIAGHVQDKSGARLTGVTVSVRKVQ
jgi:TPR repeat protein